MNVFVKSLTLLAGFLLLIGITGCEQIDEAKKAAGDLVTDSVADAKKAATDIVDKSVNDAKQAIGIASEDPQAKGENQDAESSQQKDSQGNTEK